MGQGVPPTVPQPYSEPIPGLARGRGRSLAPAMARPVEPHTLPITQSDIPSEHHRRPSGGPGGPVEAQWRPKVAQVLFSSGPNYRPLYWIQALPLQWTQLTGGNHGGSGS